MGGAPGGADVVGYVLGRAGDHRQVAAQRLHILERGGTDRLDRIDPRAVVLDQRSQLAGMFGQALAGNPAQALDIAGLGGDELARQAEFAVDGGKPRFEPGRFFAQQAGGFAKAAGFLTAVAHRDQPDNGDQQDRNRPITQPAAPLCQRCPGPHRIEVGGDKQRGPAGHSNHRQQTRGDCQPRAGRAGRCFFPDLGFGLDRRFGDGFGDFGSQRALRLAGFDGNDARGPGHGRRLPCLACG